jgi:hypothetical protein
LKAVRADAIHNLATALDYAGFDARGSHNPLSGGADLLINRQFNGNLFDFGAAELTLQGPISLQVSTGGRLLPTFDVAFTTALNAQNQATQLNYSFVTDTGPQSTTVSGSMLIDGDFSINALGFYDLTLTSSARKTIVREGTVTETNTSDSDLGPLTVSGNIFADALAVLTDPLFEQNGSENPFAAISKTLIDPNSIGIFDLASLPEVAQENVLENSSGFGPMPPAASPANGIGNVSHAIVPEPPVLILLLVGLPLIVRRACESASPFSNSNRRCGSSRSIVFGPIPSTA